MATWFCISSLTVSVYSGCTKDYGAVDFVANDDESAVEQSDDAGADEQRPDASVQAPSPPDDPNDEDGDGDETLTEDDEPPNDQASADAVTRDDETIPAPDEELPDGDMSNDEAADPTPDAPPADDTGNIQDDIADEATADDTALADAGSPLVPPPEAGPPNPDVCPYQAPQLLDPLPAQWSSEPLVVLNDNAAWHWFSDERAVVDQGSGKLIAASVASASGVEGGARGGQLEAIVYDIQGATAQRATLMPLVTYDHATPALLVLGPDHYLAAWVGYHQDCNTYFSHYENGSWGEPQAFDWTPFECPSPYFGDDRTLIYSHLFSLSDEQRLYYTTRASDENPQLLVSDDGGRSWNHAGTLAGPELVGFSSPYFKYSSNGVDRIDFLGTQGHPRDVSSSIYHAYLQAGSTYDSFGNQLDADLADESMPDVDELTPLLSIGSTIDDVTPTRPWAIDIQRYPDGTLSALWQGRADTDANDPDLRFFLSRFDGNQWSSHYLGKAGPKLISLEQDYTGTGTLHPHDPRVLYISTNIDPRDGVTQLAVHEIFRGTSCDNGESFNWTPITFNSSADNLRPHMPRWDGQNSALVWFRGVYDTSAVDYETELVAVFGSDAWSP